MSDDLIASIEHDDLESVVRCVLGDDTATLEPAWESSELQRGIGGATVALLRLEGDAITQADKRSWSVVLKILEEGGGRLGDASAQSLLGRVAEREFEVYRTGVLANAPVGLRPPICYRAEQRSDGSRRLWIEDLSESSSPPWPLSQYPITARHIGQFSGHWATRELPTYDWLLRRYQSNMLSSWRAEQWIPRLVSDASHSDVRQAFPDDVASRVCWAWDNRDGLLGALEGLPRTLCHFDLLPGNILPLPEMDGKNASVAIDWASAGIGAVGEDLAMPLGRSVFQGLVAPEDARDLGDEMFEAYLVGLADNGWRGDRDDVRLAFTVAAGAVEAIKRAAQVLSRLLDSGDRPRMKDRSALMDTFPARMAVSLDLADEALELLSRRK